MEGLYEYWKCLRDEQAEKRDNAFEQRVNKLEAKSSRRFLEAVTKGKDRFRVYFLFSPGEGEISVCRDWLDHEFPEFSFKIDETFITFEKRRRNSNR